MGDNNAITMPFHSQFGEDKFLSETVFKDSSLHSHPFFFCEVGAYDGIQSSNTLHFEEDLGWNGLCLEPIPRQARACRDNRACMVLDFAVSTQKGPVNFFIHESDQGRSGMISEGFMIQVHSERLDYLLDALCFVNVDILSIDTEGTELDAWDSIGSFRPRIVIMEFWSQPKPPNPTPVIARMAKDGYREIHRTEANLIFEFKP